MSSLLDRKLAEIRAQKAAEPEPTRKAAVKPLLEESMVSPGMEWMLDTLDELPDEIAASIESDQFIDNVIAQIDIVQAYKTWVPKNFPNGHEGRDEIQVSCPTPSHRDNNPSASLNTENNVWTCYGCGAKGDVLGMIGYWKNLDPRDKREFMSLRKAICEDLGYEFYTTISGHEEILQTKPAPKAAVPDVPTHDAPDELWDLDEAAAAGHFDKKKIEDLSQSHPELLNTLDELNAMGPKLADGTSKKSAIMDKLKAKTASDQPKVEEKPSDQLANSENQAPEQFSEPISTPIEPEKAPDQPIAEEKPAQKRKMPKFSGLDRAADAIFGPGAEKKAEKPAQEPEKGDNVVETPGTPPKDPVYPTFDWRNKIPRDTPLYQYMLVACTDDSPEEYHVANFLMLIGLILGRDVYLEDKTKVYGNLMTCIIGRSGDGKSRSEGHIDYLINRGEFLFDDKDLDTEGIKIIKNPGSGQYMTSLFRHEVEVMTPNPAGASKAPIKKIEESKKGVRGLVRWPEMSTMLTRSENSEHIKGAIISLYDASDVIGGGSLTNKDYRAFNAFGSVATTTQTKLLNKIIDVSDVNSGLVNRFLFIFGNQKPKEPRGSEIPISTVQPDVHLIKKWRDEKRDETRARRRHQFTISAGDYFDKYCREHVFPIREKDQTDLLRRLDLTFKKLCLLFSANMQETHVTITAIEQAISYLDYLVECYQIVSGQLLQTEGNDHEQAVLAGIQKYWTGKGKFTKGPTTSEIHKYYFKGSTKLTMAEVGKIVRDLFLIGELVESKPTDKRGSARYTLKGMIADDD